MDQLLSCLVPAYNHITSSWYMHLLQNLAIKPPWQAQCLKIW
jgi:hypothetical protein